MKSKQKLSEVIQVNPQRQLKRGDLAPFVAMGDLIPYRKKITIFSQRKVSGSNTKFQNGDTLLAKITPSLENGKTAFVDILKKDEIAHGSTEFIVLCGKENYTLNQFVYYLMRTPEFREKAIKSMTGTSGRQRVQETVFDDYEIELPSLTIQEKIAKILSDFDSKIENLQNQNKILEQMAQAIFKSWFVDFDGITEFENSELGKIPKGWIVGNLENICEIIMGQSPPGTTYNEDGNGIIFFQGKTDFGDFFPTPRVYCTSPKKFAEKNDVLFTVRAPIGSINIAKEKCCIGRGLASLRLKNNHGSFLYYFLKNSFNEWQRFDADGTIFGAVTKEKMCGFRTIIPNTNTIISFNKTVDPLYNNIFKNNEQIQILTKIRDSLLPKLMSGEIRI